MATGIIRNFHIQAPAPAYFPMIFQRSPYQQDEEEKLEEEPEEQEDGEEREEEEEEEDDEESDAQEEEDECLDEVFVNPAHHAVDVTRQLLRFADHISRDVRRYFGSSSGDQEACDIYSDSVPVATSGRLRYYDDLLRIARSGSPDEQESRTTPRRAEDREVVVAKGNSGLGPLAELFDHRGPGQSRGQPMIKRHLPLSFWSEPTSCCSLDSFSHADIAHTNSSTHTDAVAHYDPLTHQHTHAMEGSQPDFSDLLANWDPNPELTHTHTDGGHTHAALRADSSEVHCSHSQFKGLKETTGANHSAVHSLLHFV